MLRVRRFRSGVRCDYRSGAAALHAVTGTRAGRMALVGATTRDQRAERQAPLEGFRGSKNAARIKSKATKEGIARLSFGGIVPDEIHPIDHE
jgi:hypothetical protein